MRVAACPSRALVQGLGVYRAKSGTTTTRCLQPQSSFRSFNHGVGDDERNPTAAAGALRRRSRRLHPSGARLAGYRSGVHGRHSRLRQPKLGPLGGNNPYDIDMHERRPELLRLLTAAEQALAEATLRASTMPEDGLKQKLALRVLERLCDEVERIEKLLDKLKEK
jgi:hypothetical protein